SGHNRSLTLAPNLLPNLNLTLTPSLLLSCLSPANQSGFEGIWQIGVPWQHADGEAVLAAGAEGNRAVENPGVSLASAIVAHPHGPWPRNLAEIVHLTVEKLHFHVVRR